MDPIKILVVDDDANNRKFFAQILKREKLDVDDAGSGEEAIELINSNCYDLVVTDLNMFEVSGLGVLEAARKKDEHVQVLILTGYGSIPTAVQAMRDGAYDYLSKPINNEAFLVRIRKALEKRRMSMLVSEQQRKIDEFHEMIDKDIDLAKRVQETLVPINHKDENLEFTIQYHPMIGVGGDFADFYVDSEGNYYLTITDVTGHGIAAALVVNRIASEIQKFIRNGLEPGDLLYQLNSFFYNSFSQMGIFLTIMSVKIDMTKKIITYSGAAHPAGLLYRENENNLKRLYSQNPIIGFGELTRDQFQQEVVEIKPNDRLMLYTDGIIEAENETKEAFGIKGLRDALQQYQKKSIVKTMETIINDAKNFSHGELRDDIVLLGIDIF